MELVPPSLFKWSRSQHAWTDWWGVIPIPLFLSTKGYVYHIVKLLLHIVHRLHWFRKFWISHRKSHTTRYCAFIPCFGFIKPPQYVALHCTSLHVCHSFQDNGLLLVTHNWTQLLCHQCPRRVSGGDWHGPLRVGADVSHGVTDWTQSSWAVPLHRSSFYTLGQNEVFALISDFSLIYLRINS